LIFLKAPPPVEVDIAPLVKKEIEINPFIYLVDFSDLTTGLGHHVNIL